jgi:hypothetical protein
MRTKEEWIALFQKIGVRDPEQWAACEINENLGNLTRVAFLRQAWEEIPRSNDAKWINIWMSHSAESDPEIVAVFERLKATGCSEADLASMLRGVMGHFLFRISYLLDDPSFYADPELGATVKWGLYEENEADEPIRRLGCIHELVFEVDPEASGD